MRDDRTSYSELNTLADCERKWWFRYLNLDRREQTAQQFRGSALHNLIAGWRQGDEGPAMSRLLDQDRDEEEVEHILWLFDRYKRYYQTQRRPRIVANELRVENVLPGTEQTVLTYIDEIVQVSGGGLWAVERKSMGDWRKMALLEVDPQSSIAVWNLRAADWPIEGIIYDAINTHRYVDLKPTQAELKETMPKLVGEKNVQYLDRLRRAQDIARREAPLDQSFRMEWLIRSPEHIEAAIEEMKAGLARRDELAAGATPIRNIDQHCGWCDYRYECWTGLQFNQDLEVIA